MCMLCLPVLPTIYITLRVVKRKNMEMKLNSSTFDNSSSNNNNNNMKVLPSFFYDDIKFYFYCHV